MRTSAARQTWCAEVLQQRQLNGGKPETPSAATGFRPSASVPGKIGTISEDRARRIPAILECRGRLHKSLQSLFARYAAGVDNQKIARSDPETASVKSLSSGIGRIKSGSMKLGSTTTFSAGTPFARRFRRIPSQITLIPADPLYAHLSNLCPSFYERAAGT